MLQGEDAGEAAFYEPFQFMLQFMLTPLLVASGGTPAGATIPALLKTCKSLKRTADIGVSTSCATCPAVVLLHISSCSVWLAHGRTGCYDGYGPMQPLRTACGDNRFTD